MTPDLFVRDRYTWLAYFLLSYFAYSQAVLGPAMPFIRSELHISYTVGGLHLSAMAIGMIINGIFADRVIKRYGRRAALWSGCAGIALGSLIVIAGHHPAITIFGAYLIGQPGSLVITIVQASLADHHGPQRAIALTESNVAAVFLVTLAPLAVGGFDRIGIGWRAAFYGMVLLWAVVTFFMWRTPIPTKKRIAPETPKLSTGQRLPALFWIYLLIVILAGSVEWGFGFWGAEYLDKTGLSKADASLTMTFFFFAMTVGRAAGSRLTRKYDSAPLLQTAVLIALGGFILFWLAPVIVLTVTGLFLAGLGIANLFPLVLSIASRIGESRPDVASARIVQAAGISILVIPQVLGTIADQVGIKNAYGVVGVLLIVAVGVTAYANRFARRTVQP